MNQKVEQANRAITTLYMVDKVESRYLKSVANGIALLLLLSFLWKFSVTITAIQNHIYLSATFYLSEAGYLLLAYVCHYYAKWQQIRLLDEISVNHYQVVNQLLEIDAELTEKVCPHILKEVINKQDLLLIIKIMRQWIKDYEQHQRLDFSYDI